MQGLYKEWVVNKDEKKLLKYLESLSTKHPTDFSSEVMRESYLRKALDKFKSFSYDEKHGQDWEYEERVSTSNPLRDGVKETHIPPKYIKAILVKSLGYARDLLNTTNVPILFYNYKTKGYYPITNRNDLAKIPDEDLPKGDLRLKYSPLYPSLNLNTYQMLIKKGILPKDIIKSFFYSPIPLKIIKSTEAYQYLVKFDDLYREFNNGSLVGSDLEELLLTLDNPTELVKRLVYDGGIQDLTDLNSFKYLINKIDLTERKILFSHAVSSVLASGKSPSIIIKFKNSTDLPKTDIAAAVYAILKYLNDGHDVIQKVIRNFLRDEENLPLREALNVVLRNRELDDSAEWDAILKNLLEVCDQETFDKFKDSV